MANRVVKRWGKQIFLNEPSSSDSGALVGSVMLLDGDPRGYVSAGLQVWDCSRKIMLDFDTDTGASAAARRRKVLKLKKFINEFADSMIEMLDELESRQKAK